MELSVCSFNLRMENPNDGINSFPFRAPFIAETLKQNAPDVIGFQEVRPHMRRWLEETLTDYTILGTGREADFTDEANVIAYRTEKFLAMSMDTFWLSDTPYVPGSRFSVDQSICPRICTCAVLLVRDTATRVRVYNTHLDHEGSVARVAGIELILGRIAQDDARYPDVPVVLTGDFNAEPDDFVAKVIDMNPLGLKDTTAGIPVTFHSYHPDENSIKIDYIYTDAPWQEASVRALTECREGVYLSDHYPVIARIEI